MAEIGRALVTNFPDVIEGPFIKGKDYYLDPWSWYGREPDPLIKFAGTGYGLGQTCHWYRVTYNGWRKVFAAETAEVALAAAKAFLEAEGFDGHDEG